MTSISDDGSTRDPRQWGHPSKRLRVVITADAASLAEQMVAVGNAAAALLHEAPS